MRLIRAALLRNVAPVDLEDPHLQAGAHILQLRLRGEPVVVLAAELAGETATGSYALRLAPLDPSHEPELVAIADGDERSPASSGPMSVSASAIFDSEPPLEEAALRTPMRRFAQTLPDPDPLDVVDDELEASVLFDPEAALIGRAPQRPAGTGADDSLTIPLRSSTMPGALSFPPSAAAPTERQGSIDDAFKSVEVDMSALSPPPEARVLRQDETLEEEHPFAISREDASLTPTLPMDVPPRRGPSFRHDPNELVSEDAPTFPVEPRSQPVSSGAAVSSSKSRGPRTVRRTGNHGIVGAGRVIANRYRIESLVGAGAIGAVYKASHVDLPRTFAIKVLHPHFRTNAHLMTSFRTEARAASLLDHPHVTVVHDFGEEPDGLVYIVMEYLAGENLQTILDEERRLTPRRTIDIMLQVCAALSAAHDRGIVHRDVKPDNIMVVPARDDEGRAYELVKVCDFGIAALESTPDTEDDEWTAGTPEYMAPEQAAGRADPRTDVYACGIVLYEMLTGRPPFVGDSPVATLAKHATEQARRPSEIVPGFPPALELVILRAIEKKPENRFATMRELRTELKRLL